MPAPQLRALEHGRGEVARSAGTYQRELEGTPPPHKERREWLEWQIRRVQRRMAEVERRLAGS
jgi:hypothetical protein